MPRTKMLWLTAGGATACALLTTLLFGALQPDYHHLRDYISELGAVDAPYAWWVAWFGFLPIGLLTAMTAVLLSKALPPGRLGSIALLLMLVIGIGAGYIGAIIWPCDAGCPVIGSVRQQIHNLLGLVEYSMGGLGLLLLARHLVTQLAWRRVAVIMAMLGVAVWFALVMMGDPQQEAWRGGWQQLAEMSLFGGMLLMVWQAGRIRSIPVAHA